MGKVNIQVKLELGSSSLRFQILEQRTKSIPAFNTRAYPAISMFFVNGLNGIYTPRVSVRSDTCPELRMSGSVEWDIFIRGRGVNQDGIAASIRDLDSGSLTVKRNCILGALELWSKVQNKVVPYTNYLTVEYKEFPAAPDNIYEF